ncbi:related to ketopantoate reductase [Phialocephala subalpina]|uniref:Related to ketopantoate reductase n=1 Tax=Phialocephala subalpina TaxID=576137 RepID=A0A1L7XWA1_9HELO|nr:related to ketopantoate reductase [Phialocephala subalpina]
MSAHHLSPPGTVPTSPTTTTRPTSSHDEEFNIALLGAGGVGTIAALVLEKSGRARVTAILRASYGVVRERGWDVESVDHGERRGWRCFRVVQTIEDAVFPAPQPTPNIPTGAPTPMEAARERYDFIVICTKQLPDKYNLAEMITPLVTPGLTSIVLIQNGLFIHKPFIAAFPINVTMSAVSMIGSFTEAPNKIKHIGPDMLQIGPHYHPGVPDAVSLERTKAFVEIYGAGGAKECLFVDDMPKARWAKLLWNGTYNPICALLEVSVGAVQSSGAKEGLVMPIMRELQAVAKADGVALTDEDLEFMANRSPVTSRWRPSMLLDREQGRPMEFEVILGDPVRRGAELRVETPVMGTVYELLKLARWKVENPDEGGEQHIG